MKTLKSQNGSKKEMSRALVVVWLCSDVPGFRSYIMKTLKWSKKGNFTSLSGSLVMFSHAQFQFHIVKEYKTLFANFI